MIILIISSVSVVYNVCSIVQWYSPGRAELVSPPTPVVLVMLWHSRLVESYQHIEVSYCLVKETIMNKPSAAPKPALKPRNIKVNSVWKCHICKKVVLKGITSCVWLPSWGGRWTVIQCWRCSLHCWHNWFWLVESKVSWSLIGQ